jgi:hypothetical protein
MQGLVESGGGGVGAGGGVGGGDGGVGGVGGAGTIGLQTQPTSHRQNSQQVQ